MPGAVEEGIHNGDNPDRAPQIHGSAPEQEAASATGGFNLLVSLLVARHHMNERYECEQLAGGEMTNMHMYGVLGVHISFKDLGT